jgi:hypothetical protein
MACRGAGGSAVPSGVDIVVDMFLAARSVVIFVRISVNRQGAFRVYQK